MTGTWTRARAAMPEVVRLAIYAGMVVAGVAAWSFFWYQPAVYACFDSPCEVSSAVRAATHGVFAAIGFLVLRLLVLLLRQAVRRSRP
ncbi:MAG: hypothetical protein M3245_06740 [Actinomycetota bacterium]|nr:hypothetical protein [Actinomycetota bacterium]